MGNTKSTKRNVVTFNNMVKHPNQFFFNDLINYLKNHDIKVTQRIYTDLILKNCPKCTYSGDIRRSRNEVNDALRKNNIRKEWFLK